MPNSECTKRFTDTDNVLCDKRPGADLEIQVLKRFPKASLFIEKPITTAPVQNALNLAHYLEENGTVASVGYMLRYLKVIQHMKNIIEGTGKPVMMTIARYVCSYAKIKSEVWWHKGKSCGPVVEQGTHLVDLCRYFGGAVLTNTVQATSTEVRTRHSFVQESIDKC
jgi:predicted dehydrogenase